MTTVRFSGGPATQLICSVTRLPFMLMPYEQQWLATLSMDFVQLSCTCEGPRTVASRTGAWGRSRISQSAGIHDITVAGSVARPVNRIDRKRVGAVGRQELRRISGF